MKTIGLLGGMSWESSAEYYRMINQEVQARLGGVHSAQCVLWSFDFAEIEALQMAGDWEAAGEALGAAASALERAGADVIVLCTNTMHKLIRAVEIAIDTPVIHIADPTAQAVQSAGIQRIGLLGTRFTMEHDFYKGRLIDQYGLDVIVPDAEGRTVIHDIIYEELVRGIIRDDSRYAYQDVIARLIDDGAQGVILGCTEIMLLIQQEHVPVPVFDTTYLHALAAVDWALNA
ncbi:MAG: aspartate/glutamate racemase family protein [Anaerolineae bacterium]